MPGVFPVNLAGMGSGCIMPRDSHRTLGKPLALSFWEDFAVSDQVATCIPMVWSQPHAALSLPIHLHIQTIDTGQLSFRILSPFLSRDPVLLALGVSIWLEYSGPFELQSSLDLCYHWCLVLREHNQEGQ